MCRRGTPARPGEGSLLSPGTAGPGGLATATGDQGEVYRLHPAVARVKESVEGGGTAAPHQPAPQPDLESGGGGKLALILWAIKRHQGELRMFGGVWKKQIPKNSGQLFSLSPEQLLAARATRRTLTPSSTHPWRSRRGSCGAAGCSGPSAMGSSGPGRLGRGIFRPSRGSTLTDSHSGTSTRRGPLSRWW